MKAGERLGFLDSCPECLKGIGTWWKAWKQVREMGCAALCPVLLARSVGLLCIN